MHSCSSPDALSPAGREHDALGDAAVEVIFPHLLRIAPQLVACSLGFSLHCGFVISVLNLFGFEH